MNATTLSIRAVDHTENVCLHMNIISPGPADVRAMRRCVAQMLARCGVPQETVDAAELLASELLANAVLHSRCPHGSPLRVAVDIRLERCRVLIDVSDSDPAPPRFHASDTDDENGRGLALVTTLGSAWGCRPRADGKTVWFTLRIPEVTSRRGYALAAGAALEPVAA